MKERFLESTSPLLRTYNELVEAYNRIMQKSKVFLDRDCLDVLPFRVKKKEKVDMELEETLVDNLTGNKKAWNRIKEPRVSGKQDERPLVSSGDPELVSPLAPG